MLISFSNLGPPDVCIRAWCQARNITGMWIFPTALYSNTPPTTILIQGKSTHAAVYTDSCLAGHSLPNVLCTPCFLLVNAHPPINIFVDECILGRLLKTSFMTLLWCWTVHTTVKTQNWGPVWSRHLFHPLIKSAFMTTLFSAYSYEEMTQIGEY